jgi:hypothetical protein
MPVSRVVAYGVPSMIEPGPMRQSPPRRAGRQLVVELLAGRPCVGQPQVDRGQLPHAQGAQVVLDAPAQLIGLAVGQPPPGLVAACPDLADQRQRIRVGKQRLPDELVSHAGTVVLGGVNMVHPERHRAPQHRQRLIVVPRRAEHPRTRQLHRPEADPADTETAEGVTLHAPSLKNLPRAARQHQAGEARNPAAITGSASEPGPLGPRDLTGPNPRCGTLYVTHLLGAAS